MHEVLLNRLGGLSLPRKRVVRLTDRPDMTLDVYRGRRTTMQQQQQQQRDCIIITFNMENCCIKKLREKKFKYSPVLFIVKCMTANCQFFFISKISFFLCESAQTTRL